MSGTKNKQKALRKEAQRSNPIHWEQDWIEKVLPSINDFASKSVGRRYRAEIAADDRANWTFGSDIDVLHEQRKVVVTEWLVPIVEGKAVVYLEDGSLNPAMRAYKFTLRYDHLQEAARDASKRGTAPNIGQFYLPDVVIVSGDKGWEQRLEVIDQQGKFLVDSAVEKLTAFNIEQTALVGTENDEGKYIATCLVYNRDENLLQLVTHTRHALDVLENKEGEVNYIDLTDIDLSGCDLNVRSAIGRHASEHRVWQRIVKPSVTAYTRFSADLAEYLMSTAEEVYKHACDAVAALGNTDAKVDFEYNLMNGGLEASYMGSVVEPIEGSDELTSEVKKIDIELSPADRSAILLIAGRIEPDMWFHVQADFLRRFLATYGKGDVTVSDQVLTEA